MLFRRYQGLIQPQQTIPATSLRNAAKSPTSVEGDGPLLVLDHFTRVAYASIDLLDDKGLSTFISADFLSKAHWLAVALFCDCLISLNIGCCFLFYISYTLSIAWLLAVVDQESLFPINFQGYLSRVLGVNF